MLLGMVLHALNPNTQEAESDRSLWVPGQPWLCKETCLNLQPSHTKTEMHLKVKSTHLLSQPLCFLCLQGNLISKNNIKKFTFLIIRTRYESERLLMKKNHKTHTCMQVHTYIYNLYLLLQCFVIKYAYSYKKDESKYGAGALKI